MLADLKEAAEKRRQERSTVLQAVSGRADFTTRLQVGASSQHLPLPLLLLLPATGLFACLPARRC